MGFHGDLLRESLQLPTSPSHTGTTESSRSSGESSSSPSPGQRLPPLEELLSNPSVLSQHETAVIQNIDSNFKYRVWFSWHLMQVGIPETAATADWRREEVWVAVDSGMDADRNLWLWEDEDEEYIKAFIGHHSLHLLELPMVEWSNACRALEARCQLAPRLPASPLSHLTPQRRLLFIAWLVVGELGRRQHLGDMITYWGISLADFIADTAVERCNICRVSHLLQCWMETMLEVYLPCDLQSIPWYPRCSCFERQLASIAHPTIHRLHPATDSVALRVLLPISVSPWPLILWVAFRTMVNGGIDPLETFLDILGGPDQDLFVWDDADEAELYRVLAQDDAVALYPEHWNQYMVQIDFPTWLQIRDMTRTRARPGYGADDLRIRLATLSLKFTSTLNAPWSILAPLKITFNHFPFTTIGKAVDKNYKKQSTLSNFELKEFWTSSNLTKWLLASGQELCHAIWHTFHNMSILERVQSMYLALTVLPAPNLVMYTYTLVLQVSGHDRDMEFADFGAWEFLDSLKHYRSHLETLFTLLKGCMSTKIDSKTTHKIATRVYNHMNRDICVIIARMVQLLQDRESYKDFLASRESDAQALLDLLQDYLDFDPFSVVKPLICKALLRLSRASGLHPRCFALPELRKVGDQIAAGGFGDIWKGLVCGQSVCVKVMRLFQNADIQAVLKEFSREALIWRQLCHPNLLPFFGLYYLENRLCLISPWMDNGNVLDFLRTELPDTDRLSLILDVALGLQYLHEQNVVHGDLKAINILVTASRRACIADFGLSSIANAMTVRFTLSTAPAGGGTARYQAPELFLGDSPKTFSSDVYAFACVCYEILTGKVPFHELANDMRVMFMVAEGQRPSRPPSCSGTVALDSLWELLQNCWDGTAEMRPTASQIVERLVGPPVQATTTSSTPDWDDKFTSKFRRSLQTQSLLPSVTQLERMLFGDEAGEACKDCYPDQEPLVTETETENKNGPKKYLIDITRQTYQAVMRRHRKAKRRYVPPVADNTELGVVEEYKINSNGKMKRDEELEAVEVQRQESE